MNIKNGFISALILANLMIAYNPAIGVIKAQSVDYSNLPQAKDLSVIQGNALASVSNPSLATLYQSLGYISSVSDRMEVTITGYSSTPGQTDSTPFITASNQMVKDGIVANNFLPFGTKIKIPALYGDKVFEVQDRMHSRMGSSRMDIWFPTYNEAKKFGVKKTYIEILED